MAKIGFIGLGNMGAPMAMNLAKEGHIITGFDVSGNVSDAFKKAESAKEAAKGQDVIITMLPNGGIVRSVYQEILPEISGDALLIDCSTIDVESAKDAHNWAEGQGFLSVDAPVSGGVGGAEAGTLTFMCGGDEVAFQKATPFLQIMGQKIVHCGAGGTGQMAKICNNMVLAISMIGVCEAFNLADNLGLSRQAMFDVVSTSSGSCWSINTYCPVPEIGPKTPADNNYEPGFASALMLKDLKLSAEAANMVKAATPMGEKALALYEQFVDSGKGGKDFSAIINLVKEMNE